MSRVYFKVPINPEKNIRNMERYLSSRMAKAMAWLEGQVKKLLSRSQPVRRYPSGYKKGLDPSRPGDPPKQVSTRLKQSVAGRLARRTGRIVGKLGILANKKGDSPDGMTVDEYAYQLEFDPKGRLHGKRPFLWPTLKKNKKKIIRFFQ